MSTSLEDLILERSSRVAKSEVHEVFNVLEAFLRSTGYGHHTSTMGMNGKVMNIFECVAVIKQKISESHTKKENSRQTRVFFKAVEGMIDDD